MAVVADSPLPRRIRARLRDLWARRWIRRSVIVAGALGALLLLGMVYAYAAISLP